MIPTDCPFIPIQNDPIKTILWLIEPPKFAATLRTNLQAQSQKDYLRAERTVNS